MDIRVKGAKENNLKNISVEIHEGLTAITGVSGSGKSSLIFDTIYYEARRRLLEIFRLKHPESLMFPADVDSIEGLRPAIAVMQNTINRNPNSTLATATGIHALLRILYANFGNQHCTNCNSLLNLYSEDLLSAYLVNKSRKDKFDVYVRLVNHVKGSHRTLLEYIYKEFERSVIIVDGQSVKIDSLDVNKPHTIDIRIEEIRDTIQPHESRNVIQKSKSFGTGFIIIKDNNSTRSKFSFKPVCTECNTHIQKVKPSHFNKKCPFCEGESCAKCNHTGIFPEAAFTKWENIGFIELLNYSVEGLNSLIQKFKSLEGITTHLKKEIINRIGALLKMRLGYLTLNRSSPTLSRGEYQRIKIAMAIANNLEDVFYLLDEPTIGLHPYDIQYILPEFRQLKGPVVYVEHDIDAILAADHCIEIGPDSGNEGGEIVFEGETSLLHKSKTATSELLKHKYESKIKHKSGFNGFIKLYDISAHNLKNIDVKIPIGYSTVIVGVSGSGKSTLLQEVILPSIQENRPVKCKKADLAALSPVFVNQEPIGKNSRSNPSTYINLFDQIRNVFAEKTGLSPSHFTFNRAEGACSKCSGLGEIEIKMRYVPSTWIKCPACNRKRYSEEVLSHTILIDKKYYSIADILELNAKELLNLVQNSEFSDIKPSIIESIKEKTSILIEIGLGYLKLGQPSTTLSGGEAQRIKLAKYLGNKKHPDTIIILDEPTTGLHGKDIVRLIQILEKLKSKGITVLTVEHNLEIIKTSDWIIELGPGSGPNGGELVFMDTVENLVARDTTRTSKAILQHKKEIKLKPVLKKDYHKNRFIEIENAYANNLKNISVKIPKSKLTVITGVSGSGKSTFVWDIIEAEAKRNFLESLSIYERYGTADIKGSQVDSIKGLGLVATIAPEKLLYDKRSTIGTITNTYYYLATLFAEFGDKKCKKCGAKMGRHANKWLCKNCSTETSAPKPEHFLKTNYAGACTNCQGVGNVQVLDPEKIIVRPEKPLCGGAMHSPGFFPKGFLCKTGNSGYYFVKALAKKFGFLAETTPWKDIPAEARKIFLFGENSPWEVQFENTKGQKYTSTLPFPGFAGWISGWDIGGTYTNHIQCKLCNGSGLKKHLLEIELCNYTINELSNMPIDELYGILSSGLGLIREKHIKNTWNMLNKKLKFLIQTGLSYAHLNRLSSSLSAGEAQRIKLATLLGNELNNLLILLDEPTRGLHHQEIDSLKSTLKTICQQNNTVIVIEHDSSFIKDADHVLEFGPKAGINGGEIVFSGEFDQFKNVSTITTKWLDRLCVDKKARRAVKEWVKIVGASEHNLKNITCKIPLNVLTGVCGVSGSGKSTLIIDTLARSLSPTKQTTSVAYEPIQPGKHDSIDGAPNKVVLIDQVKPSVANIANYLRLDAIFQKIYSESEASKSLKINNKAFSKSCTECGGKGNLKIEMEFLPSSFVPCESCGGTGYPPEAWSIKVKGFSLPEVYEKSVDEVYSIWKEEVKIEKILKCVIDTGLGYLIFQQPPHTLSSGEMQRLKISMELSKKMSKSILYILDEPTVGLHNEDVKNLIQILNKLVDEGNSVWVIEHHLYLLSQCDYLIELGPKGGPNGGKIIAQGIPEEVVLLNSPTAKSLKHFLP